MSAQSSSRDVATPAGELFPLDQLAGRVARVGEQERGEAAAEDLATQVVDAERVAPLGLEEDRDGGERLEDVEQLLVRRVVRQEVAEVDVTEARRRARERRAPAAGDGDVLGGVLRRETAAIEAVVERRDRLAELPEAGRRGILLVVPREWGPSSRAAARRGSSARLGLPWPRLHHSGSLIEKPDLTASLVT